MTVAQISYLDVHLHVSFVVSLVEVGELSREAGLQLWPKATNSWLDPKRHLPGRPNHRVRVRLAAIVSLYHLDFYKVVPVVEAADLFVVVAAAVVAMVVRIDIVEVVVVVVVFGVLLLAVPDIVHVLASRISFVVHVVAEAAVVEEASVAAGDAVESVITVVLFALHQEDQVSLSAGLLVDLFQHSFVL